MVALPHSRTAVEHRARWGGGASDPSRTQTAVTSAKIAAGVVSTPPPPRPRVGPEPLGAAGRGGGRNRQVPSKVINVYLTLVAGQGNATFTHKTFVGKRFRGHRFLHPTRGVNQGRRVYEGDSLSRREKKKERRLCVSSPRALAPDAGKPLVSTPRPHSDRTLLWFSCGTARAAPERLPTGCHSLANNAASQRRALPEPATPPKVPWSRGH